MLSGAGSVGMGAALGRTCRACREWALDRPANLRVEAVVMFERWAFNIPLIWPFSLFKRCSVLRDWEATICWLCALFWEESLIYFRT